VTRLTSEHWYARVLARAVKGMPGLGIVALAIPFYMSQCAASLEGLREPGG